MRLARRGFVVNEMINGLQFRRIIVNDTIFKCNIKYSFFKTVNGDIAVFHNIVQRHGEIFFVGYSFTQIKDVY